MNALLLGASGLVGGHCLHLLLNSPVYDHVIVVGRRKLKITHEKLHYVVSDLTDFGTFQPPVPIHHVFCAFGTTIKKAGSEKEMERIDVTIPLEMARAVKSHGASYFGLVSALGANANSRLFYNRIKGELEDQIIALGFDHTCIARPSVIGGVRVNDERGAESLLQTLMRVLPKAYRTIGAERIALALVRGADFDGQPRVVGGSEVGVGPRGGGGSEVGAGPSGGGSSEAGVGPRGGGDSVAGAAPRVTIWNSKQLWEVSS